MLILSERGRLKLEPDARSWVRHALAGPTLQPHAMLSCIQHHANMYAMIRTQVQLTEQQMRRLKRLAADREVSVSELVRNGVDSILDTAEQASQTDRERRALATLGRFSSGRSDVSREHDRYLAEAYARRGQHER